MYVPPSFLRQGAFSFFSIGCTVGQLDQFDRLLIATLGPAVVIAAIQLFVLPARLCLSKERALPWKRRAFQAVLGVLFLAYPSVSVEIVKSLRCDKFDDGSSYLHVDYSINCDSLRYKTMLTYSIAMIFLYPLGVPAYYWSLLSRYRNRVYPCNEGRLLRVEVCGHGVSVVMLPAAVLPGVCGNY